VPAAAADEQGHQDDGDVDCQLVVGAEERDGYVFRAGRLHGDD
jgi:hypothetical protein